MNSHTTFIFDNHSSCSVLFNVLTSKIIEFLLNDNLSTVKKVKFSEFLELLGIWIYLATEYSSCKNSIYTSFKKSENLSQVEHGY